MDEIHSGYRTDLTTPSPPPSLPPSLPPLAPSAQVLLARNAWSFCRAAQSKAAPVECYNFALPLPSPPPTPAPSLFSSQSPFIYPAIFLTPTSPPGLSPPLSRWRNERLLSLPPSLLRRKRTVHARGSGRNTRVGRRGEAPQPPLRT